MTTFVIDMEVWKKSNQLYNLIEVSNIGNVRSIDREVISIDGVKRKLKGKVLKSFTSKKGYNLIPFKINGIRLNRFVHRLVAECFIEKPIDKQCVNHKNGIKNDNRVENLEWVTFSENSKHSYSVLKRKPNKMLGSLNGRAKLNEEKVLKIRNMYSLGIKVSQISLNFKIPRKTVSDICRLKTWRHI